MWIAKRFLRFSGKPYRQGERVPAEGDRQLNVLRDAGWLAWVDDDADAEPDAETKASEGAVDLSKMKRPELDAYAADLGIADAADLPNIAAVIAAIEQLDAETAHDAPEGPSASDSGDEES